MSGSGAQPIEVVFEPSGIVAAAVAGETLLDCARRAGAAVASACGGRGICKTCLVQIVGGDAPPPTPADAAFFSAVRLEKGWRRACQVVLANDCRVEIPARARARGSPVRAKSLDVWIAPDPVVRGHRQADGLSVTRFGEVIALLPARSRLVGLAVDMGTTNIGVFLVDLRSGMPLGEIGIENPQAKYGADVITRMNQAMRDPAIADDMRRLVANAINAAVSALAAARKFSVEAIVDVVVAGNSAMHHLFLGLAVDRLGRAPYTPVITAPLDVKARDLGLASAPGAYVHMLPNIAGFIGGDHAAMLLGIRADAEKRTVLALDIGTNTEISLIHGGGISSLSCPSGPALEGGNISCGMRAANGAIDTVTVQNGDIAISTIGGGAPVGLCGSAVLDAAAAFFQLKAIDARGRIISSSPRFITRDGHAALDIVPGENGVYLSQQDIRNIQLAKGAIRAGIEILLEDNGLKASDLDLVVVAGAFGSYIRIDSALAIGMLPDLPLGRFEQVGDAAGLGARLALLSQPMRASAAAMAKACRYIELSGSDRFMRRFMTHIPFAVPGNKTSISS